MPVITFLFSLLARKVNTIIQAIFGWSITALFGRLPRKSQVLVTGALLLSLAWPVFVIGVIVPRFAAWAIALVPLHDYIGDGTLRIIWIALAVSAPPLVGLLVWLAAPKRKGGVPRALVNGYPMTLGFFIAFVIVLVTVPIIKIASLVRRWSDEHVYIQPLDGQYEAVIHALAEASARAGFAPRITDAPQHMVLATTVMRTFAGGSVTPFLTEKLKRVSSDGLEMYLYPADLLLRGDKTKVAHVRTMLTRTELDHHAYLVADTDAQKIQAELSKLHRGLDHGDLPHQAIATRLQQAYMRLMNADMQFTDWVIIDGLARKLERRLLAEGVVQPGDLPIDHVGDHLGEIEHELEASHQPAPAWLHHHERGSGSSARHVNRRA